MKLTWYHPENLFGVLIDYALPVKECYRGVAMAFAKHCGWSEINADSIEFVRINFSIAYPLFDKLEKPVTVSTEELLGRWTELVNAVHYSWRQHLNMRLFLQLTAVKIETREFILRDQLACELRKIPLRTFLKFSAADLRGTLEKKSHSEAMAVSTS